MVVKRLKRQPWYNNSLIQAGGDLIQVFPRQKLIDDPCKMKPSRHEYLAARPMLLTRPFTGGTGAGHPKNKKT